MKRFLFSLVVLGMTSSVAIGATTAYFSDTEVSSANTFTAGTLDLKLNGGDVDVTLFNLTGLRPGNQPNRSYRLMNSGTVPGKISISKFALLDTENDRTEPEVEAGDVSDDFGELSKVLNLRIWIDNVKNGYYDVGDVMVFNDKMINLPTSLDLNKMLQPTDEMNLVFLVDWWNTSIDNQAQGDELKLDVEFTLKQDI